MKICVIGGGGAAGICAIKHCLQNNLDVIGFEQTSEVGGTWVYTDQIGKDIHNLPIHSSMYRNLHTNLPKELMCFPDFPFPPQERSYLPAIEVLAYLNAYADTFNVREKIKFNHYVVRVRPFFSLEKKCEIWEVLVKDLNTQSDKIYSFDAVLLCNGHFSVPYVPKITGHEIFNGRQMHSHDYRTADIFTNERVLVIGGHYSLFSYHRNLSLFFLYFFLHSWTKWY